MLPSLKGGKVVREVPKRNGRYLVYANGHDDHVVNFAPKKFRPGRRQADLPGRHKTVDAAVAAIDAHYKSGAWKAMQHVIGEDILKSEWSFRSEFMKAGDDGERRKWAITGSIWQRISPEKKMKYAKVAHARHKREGKLVGSMKGKKVKDYLSRPTQEFHDRIHHGLKMPWHTKKGMSLEAEFGPLVADVMKAFQAL